MTKSRTPLYWRWICVGLLHSGRVQGRPWGGNNWGGQHGNAVQAPDWQTPGSAGQRGYGGSPDNDNNEPAPVFETFFTSTTTTLPPPEPVTVYTTTTAGPVTLPTSEPVPPPSPATPPPAATISEAASVAQTVVSTSIVQVLTTTTAQAAQDSSSQAGSVTTTPTTTAIVPPPGSQTPSPLETSTSLSIPPPPATTNTPATSNTPGAETTPAPASPPAAETSISSSVPPPPPATAPSSSVADTPSPAIPVDISSSAYEIEPSIPNTPSTSATTAPPAPTATPTESSSAVVETTPAAPSTATASVAPAPPATTVDSTSNVPSTSVPAPSSATAAESTVTGTPSTSVDSTSNTGGIFAPLPTGTSSIPVTTSYSSPISTTQSASASVEPVSGSVPSSLETAGRSSVIPFNTTSLPEPSNSIVPATTTLQPSMINPTISQRDNIFVAIATNAPPSNIPVQPNHPVPRLGIENTTAPIETNKFYANFFLGDQSFSTWTHPYSVAWLQGAGASSSWGLGISHIERSQLAYAPGSPPEYFINPLGLESVILSAVELGASTTLTTEDPAGFSVNINLHPAAGEDTLIQFPLVQGMGFVTGIYAGGTPLIQSTISFRTLAYVGAMGYNDNTFKYRLTLNDGRNWLMYVTPQGAVGTPSFQLQNSGNIQGPGGFFGTIQIAKNPNGSGNEGSFDASAGVYAVSAYVTAAVEGSDSNYTLSWNKQGVTQNNLLMFTLPHHIASMDAETADSLVNVTLETTTKGSAQAVLADSITMSEQLPVNMDFSPYVAASNETVVKAALSASALAAISAAASLELSQDIYNQSVLDSMYFSGKGLAKFATICYTAHDISGEPGVAAAGLQQLETAFATFVNNEQPFPLAYDESWKGAVSSATYSTGDSGADFGNTLYNDHHFHYGYFVYTAAVIAYLNPSWLDQGTNQAWVSMLVRDYANPVSTDPYFPFSRSFDWYHGHSWAKGLFESGDGKDEESSSEDTFSLYAMKMWGKVSGDPNMEARGNLQLAIQARSLQNYFLLEDDNEVQPPEFIPNKVTGILFENKVDHTTYFGTNIEFIEGIHMLPLNPASSLTRTSTFVSQEWSTYFSNGRADAVQGGWKGILYANLALTNAAASYQFFSQPGFDMSWLDGGASLTWYLAFSAGLGGALA